MSDIEDHEDPNHRELAFKPLPKEVESGNRPEQAQYRGHNDQEVIGNWAEYPVLPRTRLVNRGGRDGGGHAANFLTGELIDRSGRPGNQRVLQNTPILPWQQSSLPALRQRPNGIHLYGSALNHGL